MTSSGGSCWRCWISARLLEAGVAARYRTAFNHLVGVEQRREDLEVFTELAAAGELAALAACAAMD